LVALTNPGSVRSGTEADVVVALDVGGTRLKGALIDTGMRVVHSLERPTRGGAGTGAVLDQIVEAITDLADAAPTAPLGVGLVVPGIVDATRGVAVFSANLGWRNEPIGPEISHRIRLPLTFGHDVRAGALAEREMGACRGVTNAAFIAIGTGISGALIVDGQVIYAGGYAGEIGHLIIEPGGRRCGCGQRGCLEAVASGAAIGRRYAELTGAETSGSAEVVRRLAEGDGPARRVWEEAVDALARAILATMMLVAPEVVVLGGGVAEAGEVLLGPIRERIAGRTTWHRVPSIVRAELGDWAGCLGAGLLALRAAGRQ
jgi:glucokinase